jgi:hypothetical protein
MCWKLEDKRREEEEQWTEEACNGERNFLLLA